MLVKEKTELLWSNELEEGFTSFWAQYPRRRSREDARKAWIQLSPSPELVVVILQAIEAQRASWTDPKYIPYAGTWIRGQRWTDEVEAVHEAPITALERQQAQQVRQMWGRCRHADVCCETSAACIAKIVRQFRERVGAH